MASRVVLVDDVEDVRRMLRFALRRRPGIDIVAEAASGREAVRAAEEHQPDLVVLDLGLPDLTAGEVVSQIRAVSDTKIVVFTGTEIGLSASFHEPVEGFVRKDDDLRFLVDLIEGLSASGDRSAALALEMGAPAAAAARGFVAEQCRKWSCESAIEAAELIVSELTTNAVLHARSHPQLLLAHHGQSLRVEISDDSADSPSPRTPGLYDENGRGLLLVAAFSAAWGVEPTASGKRVWADVLCEPRSSTD